MSAGSGATTEQLRADIDSGRTGDKVSASDPAAAPLGADDEAAGTPPDPELVALTRRRERAQGDAQIAQRRSDGRRRRLWALAIAIAVLSLLVLIAYGSWRLAVSAA